MLGIPKEELDEIPADGITDGDTEAITVGGITELTATGTELDATADVVPGVTEVVVVEGISPEETVGATGATEAVPVSVCAC